MKRIQSKKHKIGTHDVNKISLSSFDCKRYILNDRITRLAYFHKDLKIKILLIIYISSEINSCRDIKRF